MFTTILIILGILILIGGSPIVGVIMIVVGGLAKLGGSGSGAKDDGLTSEQRMSMSATEYYAYMHGRRNS
jgi:hypothetical protein